jgi:hypothetical protein
MGDTRRRDVRSDNLFIAKRLREDSEHVAREPLPERWVDLIHHLDEQERVRADAGMREWPKKS